MTTHGMSRTRIYYTWSAMILRCDGRSTPTANARYYEKGIRVCEEWKSFEAFREWAMATGYTDELEIDRRDATGNYEPSNCRWVTGRQQAGNTRKHSNGVTSRFKGVSTSRRNRGWQVFIRDQGRKVYVGAFATEEEAARAYDAEARRIFGQYACVNFPRPGEQGAI